MSALFYEFSGTFIYIKNSQKAVLSVYTQNLR